MVEKEGKIIKKRDLSLRSANNLLPPFSFSSIQFNGRKRKKRKMKDEGDEKELNKFIDTLL